MSPDSADTGSAGALDPHWVGAIREKLLAWYHDAHRALPWREDREPYRILVSEMMLVQTTVAAVIPYFERFLARFPTVTALAEADEADVLKAWEGLGYYRRARQLQAAARAVVEDHGGTFPQERDAILALPGVGRYIAGALLSFAFDRPEPILEANTQRVLARWLGWRGDLKSTATQQRFWEAAERLVPPVGAGTFNQAFMELGALICSPKAPRCLFCPVSTECRARAEGIQDELPVTSPKPPPLEVVEACVVVRRGNEVLLVRRAEGGLWAGFWEFPTIHLEGADPGGRRFEDSPVDLAEGVLRLTGLPVRIEGLVQQIRYGVTRHKVRLDAYEGKLATEPLRKTPEPGPGFVEAAWQSLGSLGDLTMGAATRRLAGALARSEGPR